MEQGLLWKYRKKYREEAQVRFLQHILRERDDG
jgi:hypothetical protein